MRGCGDGRKGAFRHSMNASPFARFFRAARTSAAFVLVTFLASALAACAPIELDFKPIEDSGEASDGPDDAPDGAYDPDTSDAHEESEDADPDAGDDAEGDAIDAEGDAIDAEGDAAGDGPYDVIGD
jgi:hypothetical protein